jgi:hypothetical protein
MMPASAPPHVEFLEYKTPPGGRPMPAAPGQMISGTGRRTLVHEGHPAVADLLRKTGAQSSLPTWWAVPQEAQAQLGFKKAVMVP